MTGQVGVVEQATCEVRPRRARQPVGRHAQMASMKRRRRCRAETPSRAPSSASVRNVEGAVEDQAHCAADELRRRRGHGLRPAVGTTPVAGAEAGGLGGGGEREATDVLGVRPGRATRPAVDAGRDDRRERAHGADIPCEEVSDRPDPDRPATASHGRARRPEAVAHDRDRAPGRAAVRSAPCGST